MAIDITCTSSPPYIYLICVPHTTEDEERYQSQRKWVNEYTFGNEFDRLRMPDDCFPKALRIEKGKNLSDYNTGCKGGLVVSQRYKNLVESFEPGVHQFSPVEIFHRDGTPYGESFYYHRVYLFIDAVNPVLGGLEKSWMTAHPESNPDRYGWKFVRGSRDKLAVFKDKIAGRATWRDTRYFVVTFCSDAFVEKLKAGNFRGWQTINHWQEL